MNKKYTSKDSQTDWQEIDTLPDKDIDLSDVPEITKEQIAGAQLRIGGKIITKGKVRVNMLLDANIVAYFKAQAGGRGYQTVINETLKESIRTKDLEHIIRRIIREELHATR